MKDQVQKLPDPLGMISRIKSRIPKNCAVAKSQFCEIIISMRMQGLHYKQIEQWLAEQGSEHRISAPTIWRNLKKTKLAVQLPYAEELVEQWGGRIDLDLARELQGQIVAQRRRVDQMQRMEDERQKLNPRYFDKRLRGERETLVSLVKQLHSMMKSPLEAAQEALAARGLLGRGEIRMSEDTAAVLTDMLLSGALKMQENLEEPTLQ